MLTKLYSETNLIEDISFHNGINIIMGKYSQNGETRGINGIGKSLVIRLIDFALLSGKAEKVFAQKKYSFLREDEHSISLEFKVGQKTYFLKRFFSDLDIIHFGDNSSRLEEFQKSALNKILEGIFFPTHNNKVFFEGKRYRTLMEFFIKDDLQNQQRVDPLNFFHTMLTQEKKRCIVFIY